MATKTTQKFHVEKHEIEKMVHMAINALGAGLRRGAFTVETDGDTVMVEAVDIKAFISRQQIIITLNLIDIHYRYGKSIVKVYDYEKDDYIYIDMSHLNRELEKLLELAKEKVKEKLEKVLKEIE